MIGHCNTTLVISGEGRRLVPLKTVGNDTRPVKLGGMADFGGNGSAKSCMYGRSPNEH